MSAKKTTIAALAATLLVSASSAAVFAKDAKAPPPQPRPDAVAEACGPRPMMMRGPAAMFIYALQQFDTNKDGKISKEEAKAAEDKLFTAIDTNKDGVITPGELRKFHEARMEAIRAAMPKPPAPDAAAPADPSGQKPGDEASKAPPPPPPGDDEAMGGPDDGMAGCGPRPMGHDMGRQDMGQQDMGQHDMGHGFGPGHHQWAMDRGPDGDGMRGPHGPDDRHQMMARMMEMAGPMRMFEKIDTDENGQISKAEADAALDKLFTRFDTNKDGFISADDFPAGPPLLP